MKKAQKTLPSQQEICSFLQAAGKPVKFDVLAHSLDCQRQDKKELKKLLGELAKENLIEKLPNNYWCIRGALDTLTGTFIMTRNGGRFIPETGEEELEINANQMRGAWDKDIIKVIPYKSDGSRHAKVIGIIKRTQTEVAARVLRRAGRAIICRSIGRKIPVFFTLHPDIKNEKRLKPGHLVTVHPEKPLPDGNWQASLVQFHSRENTLSLQEALVKLSHNVPETFPQLAIEQAENLPDEPDREDYKDRKDLRHYPFVTIDGADARDFDDAIFVEKTNAGWNLRVAIADVSHYVLPDSNPDSLDGEAFSRANSWYFPKSVEPMLPKKLSNGLCSLKPNTDRLAMVVEIPFSKEGLPGKPFFSSAIIRSHGRLIYDDVADFFDGKHSDIPETLCPMLLEALALYRKIAIQRRKKGSLDFELPEPDYHFNEKGELENITTARRNDAHRLIEEFMISANEAVAKWLYEKNVPILYRVHPTPEAEKLINLFETLKKTAVEILPAGITHEDLANPAVIQQILQTAKGTSSEYVVNRLCLRSMNQARYQPDNVGHYALASGFYCHFTSPIRRYADLLVHRALKTALNLPYPKSLPDAEALVTIGNHLNKQEREALDCERDMAKRLACLLLGKKIGETLSGVISGVTEFGIFIEFDEFPAEGLIKTNELGSDWFELDPQKQMLVGRSTGKVYRLGQPMKVRILGINQDRMETQLGLVDGTPPRYRKKRGISEKRKITEISIKNTKPIASINELGSQKKRKKRPAAGAKKNLFK